MKIVLAPDSFKESMTATEAVAAMRRGVHAVMPDAECVDVPMADGGEGTVDAVVDALHGQHVEVEVSDPLGRTVTARYGYVPLRQLAVIEMAAASGLELVPAGQRDVLRASTFGVGELIRSALDRGATEFLIGLGGSATNDGGAGMLTALGAVFADADGNPLPPAVPRWSSSTASMCPVLTHACATSAFTWRPTSPRHYSDPRVPARCSDRKKAQRQPMCDDWSRRSLGWSP